MSETEIGSKMLKRIAVLSRIHLSEEAQEKLEGQLNTIVKSFKAVQSVEVQPKTGHPHLLVRKDLREDTLGASLGSEVAMKMAPNAFREHFRVPPIL